MKHERQTAVFCGDQVGIVLRDPRITFTVTHDDAIDLWHKLGEKLQMEHSEGMAARFVAVTDQLQGELEAAMAKHDSLKGSLALALTEINELRDELDKHNDGRIELRNEMSRLISAAGALSAAAGVVYTAIGGAS